MRAFLLGLLFQNRLHYELHRAAIFAGELFAVFPELALTVLQPENCSGIGACLSSFEQSTCNFCVGVFLALFYGDKKLRIAALPIVDCSFANIKGFSKFRVSVAEKTKLLRARNKLRLKLSWSSRLHNC